MKERWRPVVGYEGLYEVSSFGRVRSLDREQRVPRGGMWIKPGRVLKASKTSHTPARFKVELYRDGVGQWQQVHRMVLFAFRGPAPKGKEARHRDGSPSNNALRNLRWGTHKSNMADKTKHGTLARGSRHGMAKLTETCVERMRDLRRAGCTITALAGWIGISRPQAGQILAGDQWRHA